MNKATILLCLAAAVCLGAGVQADKCLTASSIVAAGAAAAAPKLPGGKPRRPISSAGFQLVASDASVKAASDAPAAASDFGSGDKLAFETDVASGYLTTSVEKNKPYWTIKIQFKVATPMNNLVYGSELEHPLNFPNMGWLKSMVNKLAVRVMGPGGDIDLTSQQPHVFFPVMNTAIAVAVDDAETDLIGSAVTYNLRGGRAFWSKFANRENASFEAGKHYTIVILEKNDFESYTFWWAKNQDAAKFLDGQPLQFMLADAARNTTFFKFDLWSQKIAELYAKQHCTK